MANYRSSSIFFISVLVAFVLLNAGIWYRFTGRVLDDPTAVGDLARVGYLVKYAQVKKTSTDLPIRCIQSWELDGRDVDLLTIGDSFSEGGGGGRNPCYQDYIASMHGMNVVNARPYKNKEAAETVVLLANSGFLKKYRVRALMLQTVERECIDRIAARLDFSESENIERLESFYRAKEKVKSPPRVHFINSGNFKFLLYSFLYKYSDHALFSQAYIKSLRSRFFSYGKGDKLIFYKSDIESIPSVNAASVAKLNDNLNRISDILAEQGVKFHFLPAPDKYDLYSEYIIDNELPAGSFFETLRPLPKNYMFVDTKSILKEAVDKGVLDVYHVDDSHWSWKASELISRSLSFGGKDKQEKNGEYCVKGF